MDLDEELEIDYNKVLDNMDSYIDSYKLLSIFDETQLSFIFKNYEFTLDQAIKIFTHSYKIPPYFFYRYTRLIKLRPERDEEKVKLLLKYIGSCINSPCLVLLAKLLGVDETNGPIIDCDIDLSEQEIKSENNSEEEEQEIVVPALQRRRVEIKDSEYIDQLEYNADDFDDIYDILKDAFNDDDFSAIQYAVDNKYMETVNDEKYTVLLQAVFESETDFVRTLLEFGCNPNAKEKNNNNALQIAISFCTDNLKLISLLLEAGIDPDSTNKDGQNSFDLATDKKNILDLLNKKYKT